MSERPSSQNNPAPEQPENQSGWHTPQTPGGWQAPAPKVEPAPAPGWRSTSGESGTAGGWRVTALPQELNVEPGDQGAWHLPKPEDTTFKPEDTLEVAETAPEAVEAVAEVETPAEPAAEPETITAEEAEVPAETTADTFLPFDAVGTEEAPAEPAALPFDEPAASTDAAQTPALLFDDDEEVQEDSFSMSELVALANLVEDQKRTTGTGEQPAASTAAEPVADPNDPGEYARQQLARLSAQQTANEASSEAAQEIIASEATPVEPAVQTPAAASSDVNDPGEYARRQLAQLGVAPSQEPAAAMPVQPVVPAPAPVAAVPAAPAIDPKTVELAEKYRTTESKVRLLRQSYQAGQMSREQLQADLRQLMVLDDQQVWWMMGVESDTWYKYENGQWVNAVPPALQSARAAEAAQNSQPGAFQSGQTVVTVIGDDDDDDDDPYNMPLPRAVPVRDPDFTLPGTAGVYIPPVQSDMGVTQPIGSQPTVQMRPLNPASQATVPIHPINPGSQATVMSRAASAEVGYSSVPGALPQTPVEDESAPPSYDLNQPSPIYDEVKRKQQTSLTRTLMIVAVLGMGFMFLLAACGIIGGLVYYNSLATPYQDEVAALANYQPLFQTATILDANGNTIVELNSQEGGARVPVDLNQISPYLIHALVSTENERFYEDPGWDAIAIARALIQNATAGDIQSGASTLTQQIARNLILQDNEISNQRKLQEIIVAAEIARRYDKNFILQIYLNEFFFGNRSYGVEAASRFYFNKPASDLNVAEAAMLAGILQAPAAYDPVVNPEAAFGRMKTVLRRMREQGCVQFQHEPYLGQPFCIDNSIITLNSAGQVVDGQAALDIANIEITRFQPREYEMRYPHFVNFVQAEIEQYFGTSEMYRRGFVIQTTLIPAIQTVAQDSLARQIQAVGNTGLNTGAVMVTDPITGAIHAMVGSPNFNDDANSGQVNNALTYQQPGSAIKPIEYIGAMEGVDRGNGAVEYLTAASILWDVQTTFNTTPPYTPVNYDGRYHGPVPLRYALQNSYNVPAVKAYEFIGTDHFRDVATRMGIQFQEGAQFGLPSALGATEVRMYDMMQVYGAIANSGNRVPLYAIMSITDAEGNVIELPENAQPTRAIQPQIAYIMSNILADNNARSAAFGLNSGLAFPGYEGLVAAKTGTANNNTDLWTMGFTNNFVVGVWMGRANDNNATNGSTATATIPVWNAVMTRILQGSQPQPFADPGGVITAQICAETGTAFDASQNCATPRNELFIQSQPPPPATQSFVQTASVDTWSGMLANQFCPDSIENRTFVNIPDTAAVAWLMSAEGRAYAQQIGLPAEFEALPAGQCTQGMALPNIRITQPLDGNQVQGTVQIIGSVTASDLNRYQIEVAPETNPEAFTIVAGPFQTQQQPGAVIAQWDTTQVTNGLYRIRLAAFANNGGYIYRVLRVGVNNPLPTATPIPPLPTVDFFGSTPLPFATTDPFFTSPTTDPFAQPGATQSGFSPLPFDISIATATPFQ